jgi:hypothetical protein
LEIQRRQFDYDSHLHNGMCADWGEYQKVVGKYQGLDEALDILSEPNALLEEDEDE